MDAPDFSLWVVHKEVANIVNMPETNYITRLMGYVGKLKAAEDDYSKQVKRADEGSRAEAVAVMGRESAKAHRLQLEALFPDIAFDE